jgi:small subunit ribosomal protein S9
VPAAGAEAESRPSGGPFWGTGRRKSAVARVRLVPGSGKTQINDRTVEQYFHRSNHREQALAPLKLTQAHKMWDVFVAVHGGGSTGQAGAVLMGIARALIRANPKHEEAIRSAGYLTRDSRVVERKKYGQRKARRRFQFSKR